MGMYINYNLSECSNNSCKNRLTLPKNNKHWHLYSITGEDWLFKTRKQSLNFLVNRIEENYNRILVKKC